MSSYETLPPRDSGRPIAALALIFFGVLLLFIGSYIGLFRAPGELWMGDVQRIMYVHVPTAWNAMLAFTFAFICALMSLFVSDWKWDARLEATIEVGVVLAASDHDRRSAARVRRDHRAAAFRR